MQSIYVDHTFIHHLAIVAYHRRKVIAVDMFTRIEGSKQCKNAVLVYLQPDRKACSHPLFRKIKGWIVLRLLSNDSKLNPSLNYTGRPESLKAINYHPYTRPAPWQIFPPKVKPTPSIPLLPCCQRHIPKFVAFTSSRVVRHVRADTIVIFRPSLEGLGPPTHLRGNDYGGHPSSLRNPPSSISS